MTNLSAIQDRDEAMRLISKAHIVYVDVQGGNDVTVMKTSKQEAMMLVRSPRWMLGYHAVERPDLGPRSVLISRCEDHSKCSVEKAS